MTEKTSASSNHWLEHVRAGGMYAIKLIRLLWWMPSGYGEACILPEDYMTNWVILFARTGAEEKILFTLKEKLNAGEYLPFLPTKETLFRSRGVISKVRRILFPGYIFIKTEIEAASIAEKLNLSLTDTNNRQLENVYSILHYGSNEKDVAVRKRERLYWERLLDSDFCVRGSTGVIVGGTVSVVSGPLIGKEGCIKKINRHKREAVIEMDVMGAQREVRVMLEIVEKL